MDAYFPCGPLGGELCFSRSKKNELWVMLLEKAWAKIHGNYTIIDGGDGRESMSAITRSPDLKTAIVKKYCQLKRIWSGFGAK